MLVTYGQQELLRMFGEEKDIYLRPSMCKYSAPQFQHLEIHGWSKPRDRPAKLQRAFIQVLHTLGLPYERFREMTLAEIDRVQSIALDRDKALAWLERDGAELDSGEITMTDTAYRMIKAGHDVKEPRVQELTGRMIGAFMVSFREKLSIPVSQSAFVYGICDETRTLKENEVVVHASRYGYITGKVLVSRSPCGHPGDFRLLEAVRPPLGPQWKNCIVFPMAGRQPVADQMSGGDLDGDEFFITWNEELFPPNVVPADPRTPRPKTPFAHTKEYSDEYLVSCIKRHVASQLLNYQIGKTHNMWEEMTEESVEGAASKLSLYLNTRYEAAMDTNKSGEEIPPMPTEAETEAWRGPRRPFGPIHQLRSLVPAAGLPLNRAIFETPRKSTHERENAEWVSSEVRLEFQLDPDLVYKPEHPSYKGFRDEFYKMRKGYGGLLAQAQRRREYMKRIR